MTITKYIRLRENKTLENVQREYAMSEADAYIWELGYQCYLKKLPLDKAIEIIQEVV